MKKHAVKVPVILQMEALECGAASLAMVLAYYKKFVPLEQVRLDCNISRDGSSAKYILRAARHHGLEAEAFRMSLDGIRKSHDLPAIIHWNFNHFVVLCGFKGNKAVINDPAEGRILVDMEEFDRAFTGVVITLKPSESFQPAGKPKSIVRFIGKRLKGNKSALTLTIMMGFVISVLSLMKSVFYKLFTDKVLIGGMSEWMRSVVTGMTAVLAASFIAEIIRSVCLARLQAKMSIGSSSSFMWHILRLPVEFYSQRFAGDVADRQQSNDEIAYMLCNQVAPIVLNILMIIVYLAVMLFYNVVLSLVGITMAIINLIIIKAVSKHNANAAKSLQRDGGKLAGVTISGVSMIETIKASGAETGYFEKIAGYQAKYSNALISLQKRNTALNIVPEILSGLSTGIILMLGVYYIFRGEFTIGALMAFQSLMNLFLSPVSSLAGSMKTIQEMNGDMERVDDVMNYKTDVKGTEFSDTRNNYEKLSGNLEIKDLCFAYSPLAPDLIENFSMKAEKGQMIALVGGSGSGKSTIAKVLAGLYSQRSGEILFDGVKREDIDRYVFTNSVASVDQNVSLFSGTIRENITMWDKTMTEETMIQACKDACIHDDIMSLEKGYDSIITEGGGNFSGGQRQRFEIARALAVQPSVLIMDEATSALDPMTEKSVMDAVKRRNITCLVIAHRLSTIRDADEIIMLDNGRETERGTHSELMALNGRYAELIKNE